MRLVKAILVLIIVSTNCMTIVANDTIFKSTPAGLSPIDKQSAPIVLRQENLYLCLNRDDYNVKVEYTFYNPSKEITTDLGFPIKVYAQNINISENEDYVKDFKTLINGNIVDFKKITNHVTITKKHSATIFSLEQWYIKTVTFPSNTETIVSIEYKSYYGSLGITSKFATYYYGSGNTWKTGIEKLNLFIQSKDDNIISNFAAPFYNNYNRHWIDSETWESTYTNIKPNSDDEIQISMTDICTLDYNSYFYDSQYNVNYLDITLLTKKQLSLVRNGIYARLDYKFKSKELENFFSDKLFKYTPKWNNVDNKIGTFQKQIITSIQNEEKKR